MKKIEEYEERIIIALDKKNGADEFRTLYTVSAPIALGMLLMAMFGIFKNLKKDSKETGEGKK